MAGPRGYDALRPDPLRIPPNAATRAVERFWECIETQNWETLGALCAPIVWEDRRPLIRTSGNCDMILANAQVISRARSRVSRTLLATAGDRLMLQLMRFTGRPPRPIFETDTLNVFEVDAAGRIVALITLGPDDRRAASAEMLERYARSEAARCIPAGVFEMARALGSRDLDRLRAALPDDFAVNDRRRTGIGRIENTDEYVASEGALFEQTSELAVEFLYVAAVEEHGLLGMAHTFGTLATGGEYEMVYVLLTQFQGDRYVRMELFEPEDFDVARARFDELRPKTSPSAAPGRDAGREERALRQ
jgi:hypothetical protein